MKQLCIALGFALACTFYSADSCAELDLRNASLSHLENGLTVILLEDRNFPVVSVQTLYRIGARDETTGQSGLAHFLEHMAFRATESFPDTGVVSEIYARGGEWHGYTWTDETTYFATVPKEHLDLLLRIESERMSRLIIDAADMDAERGAVLAEMHSYENDPSIILFDAVLFTSFLGHPYRNNTIGWESDIESLRHEDVVAFYKRHYVPANAVIAVVGDFEGGAVSRRIAELFADIEARPATPLPHTIEPPQTGERRVRLAGAGDRKHFKIAWRAPSASNPDYAAFLVLQEWLGGGSGVSFLQNDWGTPVRPDSVLAGSAENLTTWFPPSAQDYVFLVSGNASADAHELAIENEIERRIAQARETGPDERAVRGAVDRILDELLFDVETTEDAAHQLAFFDGLGALDNLLQMPELLAAVTADDVRSVARRYLRPEQRSIGWWVPGDTTADTGPALPSRDLPKARAPAAIDSKPLGKPAVLRLANGIPVIVTESDFSPAAYLRVVVPSEAADDPVAGHTSLKYRFRPDAAEEIALQSARDLADFSDPDGSGDSPDPEARLEQAVERIMAGDPVSASNAPIVIAVAGDLPTNAMIDYLERAYGDIERGHQALARTRKEAPVGRTVKISMGRSLAQAQIAYVVPAPAPRDPDSYAWRLLLYVLSHHYEGRLGKKAISDRGLAYYIDSNYRSNGRTAWITMAIGVDPEKLETLQALFETELARLRQEPPTAAEIEEARGHLVGRAKSAAQSNEELTAMFATQWIWYGKLQSPDELREALDKVSDDQLRAIAKKFARGTFITVTE